MLWLAIGLALAGAKADEKACRKAREGGTTAHWSLYLDAWPDGVCASEARARVVAPRAEEVAVAQELVGTTVIEVTWANVTVEVGPLTPEVAAAGLDTAVPALRECGLAEAAGNPEVAAMTDAITVLVDAEGHVTDVAWRNGGWPEAARACAAQAVMGAKFSLGLGTTTVGATLTIAPR